MTTQVGRVGLMILDQRVAKSNIKDLLSKQGMAILTILQGLRVQESNQHIRHVVAEGETNMRIHAVYRHRLMEELLMTINKISKPTFQPQ
jgi:hypothetical protein